MVHPLAQLYLPFILIDYRGMSTKKYRLFPHRSQVLVEWVVGRSHVQRQRHWLNEQLAKVAPVDVECVCEGMADGGWPMVRFYLPS